MPESTRWKLHTPTESMYTFSTMTPAALTAGTLRRAGLGAFFRPGDIEPLGITEPTLRRLVRDNLVEKVARGLYRLIAMEPGAHYTLAAVCARAPQGILCLHTALQFHGIGTRTSPEIWLAIPHGSRAPAIDVARLRVVRFRGQLLVAGVDTIKVDGVPARITDPARTVVDCFRLTRLVDRETALEALRAVLQDHKTSPARLLRTAETCGAAKPLRTALEVLGA